nr:hypothetical protein [Lederbergia citri]
MAILSNFNHFVIKQPNNIISPKLKPVIFTWLVISTVTKIPITVPTIRFIDMRTDLLNVDWIQSITDNGARYG